MYLLACIGTGKAPMNAEVLGIVLSQQGHDVVAMVVCRTDFAVVGDAVESYADEPRTRVG